MTQYTHCKKVQSQLNVSQKSNQETRRCKYSLKRQTIRKKFNVRMIDHNMDANKIQNLINPSAKILRVDTEQSTDRYLIPIRHRTNLFEFDHQLQMRSGFIILKTQHINQTSNLCLYNQFSSTSSGKQVVLTLLLLISLPTAYQLQTQEAEYTDPLLNIEATEEPFDEPQDSMLVNKGQVRNLQIFKKLKEKLKKIVKKVVNKVKAKIEGIKMRVQIIKDLLKLQNIKNLNKQEIKELIKKNLKEAINNGKQQAAQWLADKIDDIINEMQQKLKGTVTGLVRKLVSKIKLFQ